MPGRPSYSAHSARCSGPLPARATNAVGKSHMPPSTVNPAPVNISGSQLEACSSSNPSSGWARGYGGSDPCRRGGRRQSAPERPFRGPSSLLLRATGASFRWRSGVVVDGGAVGPGQERGDSAASRRRRACARRAPWGRSRAGGAVRVEDLDDAGIADRHVEAAQRGIEEPTSGAPAIGSAGEDRAAVGVDLDQHPGVAGAEQAAARDIEVQPVRAGVARIGTTRLIPTGSPASTTAIWGGSAMLTWNDIRDGIVDGPPRAAGHAGCPRCASAARRR